MRTPAIPENEAQRLATLRALEVLDTNEEERFDRLTRMARRMFRVPIALVSLVDSNRQWFKSCVGLDVRETPRDISFCGHAILGDSILLIPDALEDPRFSDNPLVVGSPNIRFYAGCPLKAPNGQILGTLCLIDRIPRTIDRDDHLALVDLAAMVEHELAALDLATTDELTGLSNRRGFLLLARQSLEYARRYGHSDTLVFFDLDHFKPINDIHGHEEGDRVLKLFAEQMRKQFRTSDVFGRLGGDEFVALFSQASQENVAHMVHHFALRLEEIALDQNLPYPLSFSAGIAAYAPERHSCIEQLLTEADQAMYAVKKGRGGSR